MTIDSVAPDWQPVLEGKLVRLQPLKTNDFDVLYAAASDPLIWEIHPDPNRYQRPVFQRYFDGAIASGFAFLIHDRATGKAIGTSRYASYSAAHRTLEIGYTFLTREFWGGTYNRDLKTLMLNHAFQYVDEAYFVVGRKNFRSQGAMRKIGGVETTQPKFLRPDANLDSNLVFVIQRPR